MHATLKCPPDICLTHFIGTKADVKYIIYNRHNPITSPFTTKLTYNLFGIIGAYVGY